MLTSILVFLAITAVAAGVGYAFLVRLPASRIPPKTMRYLEWICRYALALIFLFAAWEKLQNPYAFASDTYAYRAVPPSWATITGIALPAIEVLAAGALMTGLFWRGGAVVLGGLLVIFIAALFQAILRGIDINCGCFGKESNPVSFRLIAEDELLLLCALFPLWIDHLRRTGRWPRR
ncbi:MAG: DoxX family membrane protein [Candidatus Eisenbacteria sp.]|nr:DoxX family membrane protein [Candidatus Eisenbacteria bacterium]